MSDKKRESAIDAIVDAGGDTTGIVTPGIDTGQMRRAIIHQVESGSVTHEGNAVDFSPDTEISFGARTAVEETEEIGEVI
jgi:hypothetical protein